jgi:hypothetical protein
MKVTKRLSLLSVIVLCLGGILPAMAVDVDEDNQYVIVETALYEVHWKKAAQMGYMEAFVGGSDESLIGIAGRAFYHSSDYGGWKDWGALLNWEVIDQEPGRAVVQYESKDAASKKYTCVAHYYDSVPYIKHEVTVTADGAAVTSFQSGHEPMFEVNRDIEGMQTFTAPFPHAVYWTDSGFFGATYGPEAESASAGDWGGRNPGRMQLLHNNMGENLKDGDSATITYYVAFGKGDEKDGNDLAHEVQEEPAVGGAVSPVGSLTTTWGRIRAGR